MACAKANSSSIAIPLLGETFVPIVYFALDDRSEPKIID